VLVYHIIQVLVILACGAAGWGIAWSVGAEAIVWAAVGAVMGGVALAVEMLLRRLATRQVVGGTIGLLLGLAIANLLAFVISSMPGAAEVRPIIFALANIMCGYLGMRIGSRETEPTSFLSFGLGGGGAGDQDAQSKVLDASAIIDGRVADVCEAGFIEGRLIVPRFVMRELQQVADSPDPLRRARGRRGLEILKRIQQQKEVNVVIEDIPVPETEDEGARLVRFAEQKGARLLTSDYSIDKIGELHGVRVLNVNELAKALRPIFLPGEEVTVRLIKRGKESGQGVGYLEDGTMVVVDDGSNKIGRTVISTVTSLLQTTAGRMIFSKLKGSDR
jgi:uncharacterized protein YacL